MAITLFIIATITFFMMQLLPGSPFNNIDRLTESQISALNKRFGLNDPIAVQYIRYMTGLVSGDLGTSFQYTGKTVTSLIAERIGPSAQLGFQALIFGVIIGLVLGIVAAVRQNTIWDYGSMTISILGISIPSFVFAGLLQFYIGVELKWLPVALWEGFSYTILPTISLSVFVIATIARFIRGEMVEVLSQDYIVTAKAKGISRSSIIIRHGLRNALIPVITVLGPLTVNLMTGTLVIEKIFSVPGIGEQFVLSIMTNDYPVIMGLTLLYSALFIFVIFLVDLLYGAIDPRIRMSGGE